MITIRLTRNTKGDILKYKIIGHANTDDHGKDIVCAAISVLAQTSILGIHKVLEVEPEWTAKDGKLHCTVPDGIDDNRKREINAILETMVLGFENIQNQYPESIRIETKEVR